MIPKDFIEACNELLPFLHADGDSRGVSCHTALWEMHESIRLRERADELDAERKAIHKFREMIKKYAGR